jgi:hypothetical protein
MPDRPQKNTFAEIRDSGVRGAFDRDQRRWLAR